MNKIKVAIGRMIAAGFSIGLTENGGIAVSPPGKMSAAQRDWIKANREAIITELSAKPAPINVEHLAEGMAVLHGVKKEHCLGLLDADDWNAIENGDKELAEYWSYCVGALVHQGNLDAVQP